jgi:hypothetical protein
MEWWSGGVMEYWNGATIEDQAEAKGNATLPTKPLIPI